ncbi:hypothetical protein M514_23666 [Trichuris suis]|uniref:Uncharacterized protein n=1 Tax=Trichuris suis TaxID=68888 RepID=A0A085N3Y1_9BILA|nr:hypothetical protein M514_23666 [Trichuris suis]
MEQAARASAVAAQHVAHCTGQLQAKELCRESQFRNKKIKEAVYIKYNSNINKRNGVAVTPRKSGARTNAHM